MKTLMMITNMVQRFSREEMIRLEETDQFPRVTLFERTLNVDILSPSAARATGGVLRPLYRMLPSEVSQSLEAYRRRKQYDAVISWSERRAITYALTTTVLPSKTLHVAMLYWMSKPKQSFLLRQTHKQMDCIITWSSVQREHAINVLGIPAEKIILVRHPVDQKFYRPVSTEADMICAVGSEMRDYATLLRAMEGLELRCHIATDNVRVIRGNRAETLPLETLGHFPPNVTSGFKTYRELRELYGRSKFVVVPLMASDTDNGINAILEGMAMGKAVICSRTRGQVDAIEDGKNGILVEQGNPRALREAIEYLLANPDVAARMGRAGRELIERYNSIDGFVDAVREIVQKLIDGIRLEKIQEAVRCRYAVQPTEVQG